MPPKPCTCKTTKHEACSRNCGCRGPHDLACPNRTAALLLEAAYLRDRAKTWREIWHDEDMARRLEAIAERTQADAEGRPWDGKGP